MTEAAPQDLDRQGWHLPNGDTHFIPYAMQNSYQGDVYDVINENADSHEIAIDIGAHVGFFSHRFSQDFDAVLAFEPILANFHCLTRNVRAPNALCVNMGVGLAGMKELYLHKDTNSGSWSHIPPDGDVSSKNVIMIPLSLFHITGRVSAIKLDIQGMELEALYSAERMLLTHKPLICVEVKSDTYDTNDDVEGYLNNLGATKFASLRHDIFLKW